MVGGGRKQSLQPGWWRGRGFRRHLVVYEWIAARVGGLRVLDMACGEGYGSDVLASTAASVVGVGCAFAVMAPPRTDLPGLKTPSDGRYVFAPLSLPTLAPGQLPPGDLANTGEQHMADIRKLLLPAPRVVADDRWRGDEDLPSAVQQ